MDLNDLQALMGDNLETEDYRDLWVIGLDSLTADLLGEARRLADSLGAYVHYVGAVQGEEAIAFGADRVHSLVAESSDEIMRALKALFTDAKPEFVFLTATPFGDEIAGRLAQYFKGGALTNCLSLHLDEATRELTGTYPVYGGAYYLDVAVTTKPAILTIQLGAVPQPLRDTSRSGELETLAVEAGEDRVHPLGPAEYRPHAVALHKAAKVLAVGRAGNDDESIATAKQIADKIGAHFAGDRSAFDSGWIKQDQIVGVIGTEIAPDLYIAAGIWGDILHRAGVEGAKYLLAIHPDPNAPIFKYADAGIVGKPKDILPKLLALL